jgi:TetR/AcrR family transcriptional regulator, cholesterol catabolism regulator
MIPNSSAITEDMATTISRRDRKRQETKERLFEAAMTLLEQRDFDAVTVQMITDAADVGKGTFFNHFDSKEAVVGYFFERQFALFSQTPLSHPEDLPPDESIWEQTRRALHLLVEQHAKRDKRLTRTLLSLTLTNPIAQGASFLVKSRVKEIMTQVIRIGQERGELRQDVPNLALTEYMMSFYFYTLWRWASPETTEGLETLLDATYQLILEGVCVQPHSE